MSGTRVYVPSTLTRLAGIVASGGIGPAPFAAHAVTEALREAYADGGDEEWEYAASSAAAEAALGLLVEGDPPRRVVVAVDVPSVRPLDDADPTLVEVDEPAPLRLVAAVLVDDEDAEAAVAAAAERLPDALRGEADAVAVVDRCRDIELGWYASQEVLDLVEGPAHPG